MSSETRALLDDPNISGSGHRIIYEDNFEQFFIELGAQVEDYQCTVTHFSGNISISDFQNAIEQIEEVISRILPGEGGMFIIDLTEYKNLVSGAELIPTASKIIRDAFVKEIFNPDAFYIVYPEGGLNINRVIFDIFNRIMDLPHTHMVVCRDYEELREDVLKRNSEQ